MWPDVAFWTAIGSALGTCLLAIAAGLREWMSTRPTIALLHVEIAALKRKDADQQREIDECREHRQSEENINQLEMPSDPATIVNLYNALHAAGQNPTIGMVKLVVAQYRRNKSRGVA